jgi:hypothetical protein
MIRTGAQQFLHLLEADFCCPKADQQLSFVAFGSQRRMGGKPEGSSDSPVAQVLR